MQPAPVLTTTAKATTGAGSDDQARVDANSRELVQAAASEGKKPNKKGHEERYATVLQRVQQRQAKLAAEGGVEAQREASLLRSLPQLNLVLRSYGTLVIWFFPDECLRQVQRVTDVAFN